jgi:biopolymer transport protein ExbD
VTRLSRLRSRSSSLSDSALDLTPLLDILFILLVFFMLTAGSPLRVLETSLPSVSESLPSLSGSESVVLEIRERSYAVAGAPAGDFESLKRALHAALRAKPGQELVIASDKRAPIEALLRVLAYLQSQGIEAANIILRNEETK